MTLEISMWNKCSVTQMYLPVDVSDIEDLSEVSMNLGVVPHILRLDTSLSQIGAHGEIGDGGHHGDRCRDVVEHTVGARLGI